MLANPYFREYGIKLTDLDSYGIKKRRKGKVLIEYVNPTPFLDDSGKRPIDDIASKRYISYASQNIFADGSDKNIASVPKGLQPDRCFTSRDWDCTLYTDNDRRMFYVASGIKGGVDTYNVDKSFLESTAIFDRRACAVFKEIISSGNCKFASAEIRNYLADWI